MLITCTKMRSLIGLTILIMSIMCIYSIAAEEKNSVKSGCNLDEIKTRLRKLEDEIRGKTKTVQFEVGKKSRRMQRFLTNNYEVQSALENLQNEVSKLNSNATEFETRTNKSDETQGFDAKLDILGINLKNVLNTLQKNSMDLKTLQGEVENMKNLTEPKRRSIRHINQYSKISFEKPKDCTDLKNQGKKSGVYRIFPEEFPYGFLVLCEMESRGGGWTVIQNRYDGSQNFYLNYDDYRIGFGNLGGEFWLGLENIHHLTGYEVNELLIELVDFTSTFKYAHYGSFSIGSEKEGFSLKLLGNYEGNAGDSLIYQTGSRFSTKDMDRDEWDEGSCAKSHGGAWWYKSCDTSNLNGKYLNGELPEHYKYGGMYWGGFRGALYSLKQARMMVRPRDKAAAGVGEGMMLIG